MVSPRRRGWSFRIKLSLVAIVVAVVPLIAVGFIVDDRYEDGLGDANRDWIAEVAGNLLDVTASTLERANAVLLAIRDTLSDAERPETERIATATALASSLPALAEVGIYDAQGARIDVIRSSGSSRLPGALPLPISGGYLPAIIGEGEASVLRVEPMKTWWLVARVDLGDIAHRIDAASESPNSRRGRATVALVDTNLRVLLSADENLAGKAVGPAEIATLTGVDGAAIDKGLRLDARFLAGKEPMLGTLRSVPGTPYAIVVEIPERYVLYTVAQVRRWVVAAVATAILIAIIVGILFARRMTKPIGELVAFADELGRRNYQRTITLRRNDELGLVGDALERAATDLAKSDAAIRKEQAIRTDLGRYLPQPLVEQIVEQRRNLALGGERREITVLFADVVGFTPLAERQSAETVVTMLNELFTILTEIVFRHGGMVDKFVGDCVMATWGATEGMPDHAQRAVAAAEDMLRWLETGNDSWRERFGFTIELAIGMNSGEAIVGNFGSETRMEFTAIGDTVNVAARLEAIARPNQILATSAVTTRAGDPAHFASLGSRQLAGRAEPVELFEVKL